MAVSELAKIFKAYDVRGIYGQDIDGDTAEAIGRGLARALAELSGKPTAGSASAWGATCASPRPSWPARYRDGLVSEGAHVVDAGMVGTEMLYWLVGSRDLDGGLMCTASHNPKAYTGAKMVERGAVALSGDRGLTEVRRTSRTAWATRPAAAPPRRSTSTRPSSAARAGDDRREPRSSR